MSNVVNLNKFRKAKTREDKAAKAEENRAKFGQTKAHKQRDKAEQAKKQDLLDQHKLTTDQSDEDQE